MQLLVSVSDEEEALAAAAGGADIVDAKDPSRGALGPVTPAVFARIRRAVDAPTSAALGDAVDHGDVERDARDYLAAGAAFVKIGFAGIEDTAHAGRLLASAIRGGGTGVVAVAYADADRVGSLSLDRVLEIAAGSGAAGILIDTADKSGPALTQLLPPGQLAALVAAAHQAGLMVAAAGRLTGEDLPAVRDAGADIAGVRGAACEGGRTGRISPALVEALRRQCG